MIINNILIFFLVMVVAWSLVIYFWPRIFLTLFKRAILVQGGADGPIPINTLYTEPTSFFADPLHPSASASKFWTTGVNHDTLATAGVLDLKKGPQVLHVPDMADRYYSVQFTDPNNINFAYVGKRITGTQAGEYLITGPGCKGQVPGGLTQISAPSNSVFVLERTLVGSDSDLPIVYELAKRIHLTPLSGWKSSKL